MKRMINKIWEEFELYVHHEFDENGCVEIKSIELFGIDMMPAMSRNKLDLIEAEIVRLAELDDEASKKGKKVDDAIDAFLAQREIWQAKRFGIKGEKI